MRYPDWFPALIDCDIPQEGTSCHAHGVALRMTDGLLRDESCTDAGQEQTRDTFSYKWKRTDTYGSEAMRDHSRAWLRDRYATLLDSDVMRKADRPVLLLDAGCGSGYSAELLFSSKIGSLRYVGADISRAVDVAVEKFADAGLPSAFLQADLMKLPFADATFDVVFSEGVLHHTPSTKDALASVARLVRPGGLMAFYVYAKKSAIREFTDDYIRQEISGLSGQEAWAKLLPLTRLGIELGKVDVSIDVPEDIELLGIPKGRATLQRFFYWHVCKMFYRPDFSLEEMNHINFDWFAPRYAHRQTPAEIRAWCGSAGLSIESMVVEEAGITTVARRK